MSYDRTRHRIFPPGAYILATTKFIEKKQQGIHPTTMSSGKPDPVAKICHHHFEEAIECARRSLSNNDRRQ
jgi:hypothetical protein